MRLRILVALLAVLAVPVGATAQEPGDYIAPVDGPVIRHFEPPPTPYSAGHRGIDIMAPVGSEVVAAAAGVVRFAGQVGGQLFVSIDHPDGIKTTYSFLSAVLVRAGQAVAQGDPVARSGPGHTGEPVEHLHFGALRGDVYLDPEALIVMSLRRNLWRAVRLAPVEE